MSLYALDVFFVKASEGNRHPSVWPVHSSQDSQSKNGGRNFHAISVCQCASNHLVGSKSPVQTQVDLSWWRYCYAECQRWAEGGTAEWRVRQRLVVWRDLLIGDPSEMVDAFHMQLFSTQKSGISLARWRLECVSGAMMRRELPGGGFNFLHIWCDSPKNLAKPSWLMEMGHKAWRLTCFAPQGVGEDAGGRVRHLWDGDVTTILILILILLLRNSLME